MQKTKKLIFSRDGSGRNVPFFHFSAVFVNLNSHRSNQEAEAEEESFSLFDFFGEFFYVFSSKKVASFILLDPT